MIDLDKTGPAERSAYANGFDAGWTAAVDHLIKFERSKVAPDENHIRDLEARRIHK